MNFKNTFKNIPENLYSLPSGGGLSFIPKKNLLKKKTFLGVEKEDDIWAIYDRAG
jgi:hypothetical protein